MMENKVLVIGGAGNAEALARVAQMQSLRDKAAAAETPEDIRAAIDELEAKAAEAERYADALERKRREIAATPPAFLGNRKERRRSVALWRQKQRRGRDAG